jgi:enoyl-CoA hydratase
MTDPAARTSTEECDVLIERLTGVAVITLNNPARRNALTPDSADRLVQAFEKIDADVNIGALIVKGADGSFCSGADLRSLGSAMDDPTSDEAYGALERIYRAFTRFGEMGVPTIAAVRGSAVGAGVNLAMAADVRIVAENARIISGFLKLGLHPGGGHFQLLVQGSSRETAAAMGVFSQEISGKRAAQLGLAWESVDDAEVESRAIELAQSAASDPGLTRKAIQSLRLTTPPVVPWAAALQAERAPQLWSLRRAANRRADV